MTDKENHIEVPVLPDKKSWGMFKIFKAIITAVIVLIFGIMILGGIFTPSNPDKDVVKKYVNESFDYKKQMIDDIDSCKGHSDFGKMDSLAVKMRIYLDTSKLNENEFKDKNNYELIKKIQAQTYFTVSAYHQYHKEVMFDNPYGMNTYNLIYREENVKLDEYINTVTKKNELVITEKKDGK